MFCLRTDYVASGTLDLFSRAVPWSLLTTILQICSVQQQDQHETKSRLKNHELSLEKQNTMG
jgi:hypothetical protein